MTLININDTVSAVESALVPTLQAANVAADSAAAAASSQHQADVTTIAQLRQQVIDLQNAQNPPPPPPPPPPGSDTFLVGNSQGPGSILVKHEAESKYYNSTTIPSMLADAEKLLKAGLVPLLRCKPGNPVTSTTWASVASGSGDKAWVIPMLDGLEALGKKYGVRIYLAVHHEPDDEIIDGWKAADYVAMQMHIATLAVSRPHVNYGTICMYYHAFIKGDLSMSKMVPPQLAVLLDYLGIDIYEANQKAQNSGWTDWTASAKKITDWIKTCGNPDLPFGVFETGVTQQAYPFKPNWMHEASGAWKKAGAFLWAYWSSQVDTTKPNWKMTTAGAAEFEKVVNNSTTFDQPIHI